MNKLKSWFLTGFIAILPVVITFYIFNWLFNIVLRAINGTILTRALQEIVVLVLGNEGYNLEYRILVDLVSVIIMILGITIFGYTLRIVFISRLLKKVFSMIEKIPVIKTVYTTTRQIIDMVYSKEGDFSYKKVVTVEYPKKDMYVIGFLMAEKNNIFNDVLGKDTEIANVFIPTSPNPTSGMLVCVPRKDVHILDISVELAFKLIISGGYITEDSMKKLKQKEEKELEEKQEEK